jgi:hypothetical protein
MIFRLISSSSARRILMETQAHGRRRPRGAKPKEAGSSQQSAVGSLAVKCGDDFAGGHVKMLDVHLAEGAD